MKSFDPLFLPYLSTFEKYFKILSFFVKVLEMGYEVKNKISIVTGSARGFGKEFAIRLLDKGAKVCISDVDDKAGEETREELKERYGSSNVTFFRLP